MEEGQIIMDPDPNPYPTWTFLWSLTKMRCHTGGKSSILQNVELTSEISLNLLLIARIWSWIRIRNNRSTELIRIKEAGGKIIADPRIRIKNTGGNTHLHVE